LKGASEKEPPDFSFFKVVYQTAEEKSRKKGLRRRRVEGPRKHSVVTNGQGQNPQEL